MTSTLNTLRLFFALLFTLTIGTTARAGDPPTLTAIQPAGANVAGGNSVLITGTNLSAVTSVTFDGLPATILRQDANSLNVTTPPHAIGTVNVAVASGLAIAGSPGLSFNYADDFDAGRDFSAVQNPAGQWTYGVAPTIGQPISVDAATGITGCIDTWSGATEFPVVGRNRSGSECNLFSWSWPAGMIGIHPDNSAEYGVIRFTTPITARYLVTGHFMCIDHVVNCTVHVAILLNSEMTLFTRNIAASFEPQPFNFTVALAAGDTVDFTQGNGNNSLDFDQMVLAANLSPVSLFDDGFEDGN